MEMNGQSKHKEQQVASFAHPGLAFPEYIISWFSSLTIHVKSRLALLTSRRGNVLNGTRTSTEILGGFHLVGNTMVKSSSYTYGRQWRDDQP